MPLKRFSKIVQEKGIAFVSPYLWQDPFEFLFYHPNTKIGDWYYNVYALCFTVNSTNEEAKWQNSGCNTTNFFYQNEKNDDLLIRVKFNLREFCKALAKENREKLIYVSHILEFIAVLCISSFITYIIERNKKLRTYLLGGR